jgi:hypothetical protein
MWKGGECFIIGGGPSLPRQFGVPEEIVQRVMSGAQYPTAYSSYLEPIYKKHLIGINNAYQLGRWIEVIFFGDNSWYLAHCRMLAQYAGLKVTCNPRFYHKSVGRHDNIKYLERDKNHRHGISTKPGMVSWNDNSGFAAISLACHFGVKRIVLLGFDMRLDRDSVSHWHGHHREKYGDIKKREEKNKKGKAKSPPFRRHLRGCQAIANDAKRMGVEILNASPKSAIKDFPRVKLSEVL